MFQKRRWNIKAGFREDIGVSVRSGWEANVIRWLNHKGVKWEYEPQRFPFPVKRGTKSYVPDLWLPKEKKWIEIKGAISTTDMTRLRRFRRHHYEEFRKLTCIVGSPNQQAAKFFKELEVPVYAYYNDIKKEYQHIIDKWDE